MKRLHMPVVDARYWTAITLASIFGTNLGDLYAHESGLGIVLGLAVLVVLTALLFAIERGDRRTHEVYYWLVIIVIRTGATNIADYSAGRLHIPRGALVIGLAALLALLAWRAAKDATTPVDGDRAGLPDTGALYWLAMLTAGIFGTVLGDVASHAFGQGVASLGLGAILAVVLFARTSAAMTTIAFYWFTVAVARTAGTAIGDWFAENKAMHIGLPLSTLITGIAFAAVLIVWRSRRTSLAPA